MFLELLGLGILGAVLSSRNTSHQTLPPLKVEVQPKKNEDPKAKEVVGVEKSLEVSQVQLKENSACIQDDSSNLIELRYSSIYDIPTINESTSGQIMTIKHNKDTYFLNFKKCEIKPDDLKKLQKQVAKSISSKILEFHTLAHNEYLRDSSIENLGTKLEIIVSNFNKSKDLWILKFSKADIKRLLHLDDFFPLVDGQKKIREQFETKALIERQDFLNKIESSPLTEKQRLAVVRNNDLNLVLAAAGTGKTSVIVAKALDLIDSNFAKKNQILILAYNKKAATEIQDRILSRGSLAGIAKEDCPAASTFHALGMEVLNKSNLPTDISVFANDKKKLEMWVDRWLRDYIKSSPSSMRDFIELFHQPVNPFDFATQDEYQTYIKHNEFRTLQGELVKGYQELLIANWFFLNGIAYEYEEPYVSKSGRKIGFNYRPDFHIKNTDIYLEHFGIDRNENTCEGIDKETYNNTIKNKQELHRDCHTTLLETFHYDWLENNLESRLSELVIGVGLKIQPRSPDEIYETLKTMGFISDSAKRYCKSIAAIRVESLDKKTISKRLIENNILHEKKYTELLTKLHQAYKAELERQNRIDFDDMIIKATEAIISGRFKPSWTHILVDEFQDISMARMDFLKTIIAYGSNPILTVVGDDWQSIYRFTGGKIELITKIGEILGSHSITKLEETFRYSSSIADVAGMFIMRNPEQYKKNVTTLKQDKEPQVYLLDSKFRNKDNLDNRVSQVIYSIRKHDPTGSIAVLARYHRLLENIRAKRSNHNVFCWTFHGSKGLEADYCILIGFSNGKMGFPNMNKEEAVTEALLPTLDDWPNSEERRLFYVALTRARKKCYIIADPKCPSSFIDEMLSPKYNLAIYSEALDKRRENITEIMRLSEALKDMSGTKRFNW